MTTPTRLDMELADALGLVQAARSAATTAGGRDVGGKTRTRLARLDGELAGLQEQVNALVVADPAARTRLTGRSRRLRDAELTAHGDGAAPTDGLDALEALVGETAQGLAQWRVIRRLAKAEGRKDVRRLAKSALPLAEQHLEVALACTDRAAKRAAKGAPAP